MNAREGLAIMIALPLAIGGGVLAWAVAQDRTLLLVVIVGGLMVLTIGMALLANAAGMNWADRRAMGPGQTVVHTPPATGYPAIDALMMARLRELESRTAERSGRADLALVGLDGNPRVVAWQDRLDDGHEEWSE